MHIDTKSFLPQSITPRTGNLRPLDIFVVNDKLVLSAQRCRKNVILTPFIELDDPAYIAIGLYFAEGNKRISQTSKTRHNGELTFTNSYLKSLKCFLILMGKFGLSSSDFSWEVGVNINYFNRPPEEIISYWITHLPLEQAKMRKMRITGIHDGQLSNNTSPWGYLSLSYGSVILRSIFLAFINKILDDALTRKNKTVLALILKGYFAGDGHVSFNRKTSANARRVVEFLCNNPPLFHKLQCSLSFIGLMNLKETFPESTLTHSKAIRIYNRPDFELLRYYGILDFVDYKRLTFLALLNSYKTKL